MLLIDIKRCRRTSFDTTRYQMSLLIAPLLYPDLAELPNFSDPVSEKLPGRPLVQNCRTPSLTEVFVPRLCPYRRCPWRILGYRSSRRSERETATYRPLMWLQTAGRRCW